MTALVLKFDLDACLASPHTADRHFSHSGVFWTLLGCGSQIQLHLVFASRLKGYLNHHSSVSSGSFCCNCCAFALYPWLSCRAADEKGVCRLEGTTKGSLISTVDDHRPTGSPNSQQRVIHESLLVHLQRQQQRRLQGHQQWQQSKQEKLQNSRQIAGPWLYSCTLVWSLSGFHFCGV